MYSFYIYFLFFVFTLYFIILAENDSILEKSFLLSQQKNDPVSHLTQHKDTV